ncbi:branched-chain amino acid ABC transporter permease [Microbacterium aoyamense]|uniref:Branched-chain amino acid ABC transporter permease n=1 Tax=Microbacterium aoyamense TaxID=344166 RepID=A0ABP5AMD7_9MICO|nr:branched-chain amino acid ABC transporter permease [Microbacterium aoyamense]
MIGQLLLDGLASGAIYGGFALSLVLMYRVSKVMNFAHAEIALFGAYICWALMPVIGIGAALVIALVIGGVMSATMERFIIRPLERRSHFHSLIGMVAVLIGLNGVTAWIWSFQTKTMPPLFGGGTIQIGGAFLSYQTLGSILVVAVACIAVYVLLRHTRLGLMIRATSSNPVSARAVGVKTGTMLSVTWFIAGVIGTTIAVLVASRGYLDPLMMTPILIYGFAGAVLGGLDSPVGAIVGGVSIGVLENLVGTYVEFVGPDFKLMVALVVILVVLVFRPRGIWGSPEVSRV